MIDPNIESGFPELQAALEKGYKLADQKYEAMQMILQKAERRIRLANNEKHKLQGVQTSALISEQNQEIQEIRQQLGDIRKNLDSMHSGDQNFSIVVYGQKLAGKSTLMEILTHGDGKTIGKGTQRTVKDVRTYLWNGFKITDISGVDFSVDEINNALKTADIFLFLMTNDAQLSEDAGVFSKLKNLNKPIFGIVNIRKILNFKRRDLMLQELKKILPNSKEFESVIENFRKFATIYNQDWKNIKFLPTHLLAAYYSRLDRVKDEEIFIASNFGEIENFMLGKIITEGEFWHVKRFIDSVAIPMHEILQKLFEHSANSLKESKILMAHSEQFLTWRKNFNQKSQRLLTKFFGEITENVNQEISKFVDMNYNASNIKALWTDQLQKAGYIQQCQNLLEDFLNECTGKFENLIDALTQELKNSFGDKTKKDINLDDKKIFEEYFHIEVPDFSKILPETNSTPIAKDDAGTMFFQAFFDGQSAAGVTKESLCKQLTDLSRKTFNEIDNKIREVLNTQFAAKSNEFSKMINRYIYMLVKLGEAQREMAESLLGEYEELNSVLFNEAVKSKGAGKVSGIKVTLRIPGELLIVIADNAEIDADAISELTGEKFSVVKPSDSWDETMRKMLGCNFELDTHSLDSQTDEKTFSVAPYEKIDETELKLAQQISPYPIISK